MKEAKDRERKSAGKKKSHEAVHRKGETKADLWQICIIFRPELIDCCWLPPTCPYWGRCLSTLSASQSQEKHLVLSRVTRWKKSNGVQFLVSPSTYSSSTPSTRHTCLCLLQQVKRSCPQHECTYRHCNLMDKCNHIVNRDQPST